MRGSRVQISEFRIQNSEGGTCTEVTQHSTATSKLKDRRQSKSCLGRHTSKGEMWTGQDGPYLLVPTWTILRSGQFIQHPSTLRQLGAWGSASPARHLVALSMLDPLSFSVFGPVKVVDTRKLLCDPGRWGEYERGDK